MRLMFVLLLMPLLSLSQSDTLKNEYSEVVIVDSVNASELFSRSKLFFANMFKSAKDVIQLNDAESKTIQANGLMIVELSGFMLAQKSYARFTINIQCKDGRYKYAINNFIFLSKSSNGTTTDVPLEDFNNRYTTKRMWHSIRNQVAQQCISIIIDMKKQLASNLNDNW